MRFKKLKWERIDNSFNLQLKSLDLLDRDDVRKLLPKVYKVHYDYKKEFNQKAKKLWDEWIENPNEPLKELSYACLTNWFLNEQRGAKTTIRGGFSLLLWCKLFCAVPEERLTDPTEDYKIIPERFNLWWPKQQKCQDDC